ETGAGQHAAVAPPVEQAGAEPRLEGVEAPEHGRPIDREELRRRLHRAGAMDGKNNTKVVPFEHRPEYIFTRATNENSLVSNASKRGGGSAWQRSKSPRKHGTAPSRSRLTSG